MEVPLNLAAYAVWGANTDVGKTLVSAGLCLAAARESARQGGAGPAALYVKPVQTGFPSDSDGRTVVAASRLAGSGDCTHHIGPHAAVCVTSDAQKSDLLLGSSGSAAKAAVAAHTLFAWKDAVGPHLAVEREGRPASDASILSAVSAELSAASRAAAAASSGRSEAPLALIETAGGVLSPAPDGGLQADLLRPLRLPCVLVGDSRLGGISATLSAAESLTFRGFDLAAVVLIGGAAGLKNAEAVAANLPKTCPVLSFPPLPPRDASAGTAAAADGPLPGPVKAWLTDAATAEAFAGLLSALRAAHASRLAALAAARPRAMRTVWWPFTQHALVEESRVSLVDSRHGDSLVLHCPNGGPAGPAALRPFSDVSCSWWTQGIGPRLAPRLASAAAYAAARWGHVLFAETAHEPALNLAARLLDGPGKGWAARVFYSDDGSTALEIAIKMALRTFVLRRDLADAPPPGLRVIALEGSYHGDTLGAMDIQTPSVFNGPLQSPWYQPRGIYVDPPTARLAADGAGWVVEEPASYQADAAATHKRPAEPRAFASRAALFDLRARKADVDGYRARVAAAIDAAERERPDCPIGAAVLEPVMHGAGGMLLVDPAFQRAVAEESQHRGIPVVADEVFAGLWRLGRPSAACALLGITPDIAAYGKLLTGGTVPLAATLASEEVFAAFEGNSKAQALLHGHSYTAHPVGCHVACAALDALGSPSDNPNLVAEAGEASSKGLEWSLCELWDPSRLARVLSCARAVSRAVALGTVLAVELRPAAAAAGGAGGGVGGYYSTASAELLHRLRSRGIWGRPLGNVVYFMVSPLTEKPVCDALLDALIAEIEAEDGRRAEEGSHGGNGAVSGKAGNGGEAAGQGRAQPVP